MKIIRLFINYLKEWLLILLWFVNAKIKKDKHKEYEIVALRMQLAYYKEQVEKKYLPKARTSIVYKQFWVLMSKYYEKWKELPKLTTPKTVLNWHDTAFKKYWWKKTKPVGRPKLSDKIKALIKAIHSENPLLSAEKIREIIGSNKRKPPTERQKQSWKIFLKNHKDIWAMDFFCCSHSYFQDALCTYNY